MPVGTEQSRVNGAKLDELAPFVFPGWLARESEYLQPGRKPSHPAIE
jgi:hypothetical protein